MRWIALVIFLVVSSAQSSDGNTLPPQSVYHLKVSVENQFAERTGIDLYRGHPVLVTMFYASCPHICPLLISSIKLTESKLPADARENLRVLAISIDPERDTPQNLRDTMERHSVDSSRWSLVRPEPDDLRSIAGVFGVKYKQLPDGGFNHTTKIVLLDRDGTELASTDQLGRVDAAFLEAINQALQ